MIEYLLFVPTLLCTYAYRTFFVLSLYILMAFYGKYSDKKPIVPYRYKEGDKVLNSKNLVHKFTCLSNLPNGVKFHYVTNIDTVKGDYVVVFLHGILESWYSWKHQLVTLDQMGISCLALDLKNHGNTSAHYAGSVMTTMDVGKNFDLTHQGAEIAEFLEQIGVINVVFVTTDLGSLICDKLLRQFYKPNMKGWVRCHETMPAYPNIRDLPQQYLFWFNKRSSLALMHNSNDMLLRIFYRATGWKSCESFSATYVNIDENEVEECLKNSYCPYANGIYKGANAGYMSWCGAYGYAFYNDTGGSGPALNYDCYKKCDFPTFLIFGEYDKSCKKEYVDGTLSLGYKFVNNTFCSEMISNPSNGYEFFNGLDGIDPTIKHARRPYEFFKNCNCTQVILKDVGHMSHVENPPLFTQKLVEFLKQKI